MKMRLSKTKSEILEVKDVPGLMSCKVMHTLKSSQGDGSYIGPKIPMADWHQVLAFLKWVNDTTHSEAQVRCYVNPNHGLATWRFWAYPQEARGGMSATELDNDDAKKQREQFKDSEGWVYFGTVHSHCSMAAFQSSTDETNEKNQDGIHVTIGKLKDDHYDMHVRFYRAGMMFEPDMSEFWDIGEPWNTAPESFCNKDAIARWQMCVPGDDKFPEAWKANLIEKKVENRGFFGGNGGMGGYSGYGSDDWSGYGTGVTRTTYGGGTPQRGIRERIEDAARKFADQPAACTLDFWEEFAEVADVMTTHMALDVFRVCHENDIEPDDLAREILGDAHNKYNVIEDVEEELQRQAEVELEKQGKNGKKEKKEKK